MDNEYGFYVKWFWSQCAIGFSYDKELQCFLLLLGFLIIGYSWDNKDVTAVSALDNSGFIGECIKTFGPEYNTNKK